MSQQHNDMKYEDLQGRFIVLEKRFDLLLALYEHQITTDELNRTNPQSYTLLTKRVRTYGR